MSAGTLREALAAGPLPPRRALRIARQILTGLEHAHAQGSVHRDLKPENVMIEPVAGVQDHVRLVGFAAAKVQKSREGQTVAMAVGAPTYMAPEQVGEGTVDERTDLYAVGVVLFELLTGKPPFHSAELGEVFLQQLHTAPPRLRTVAPQAGFSAELEGFLAQALAKAPAERFQSAKAMAAALASLPEASPPFGSGAKAPAKATAPAAPKAPAAAAPTATPAPKSAPAAPKTAAPAAPTAKAKAAGGKTSVDHGTFPGIADPIAVATAPPATASVGAAAAMTPVAPSKAPRAAASAAPAAAQVPGPAAKAPAVAAKAPATAAKAPAAVVKSPATPAKAPPATNGPAVEAKSPPAQAETPAAETKSPPARRPPEPRPPTGDPLQDVALEIIAKCEAELTGDPPAQRAASLHYEMAQAYETALADLAAAATHYAESLALSRDHVPTVRGFRRVLIELTRFADALPVFDAEVRVSPDPKAKALLLYQKGRLLEEALGQEAAARDTFAEAVELDPTNRTLWKALERCHQASRDWASLAAVYERAADTVKEDPRLRAALMVARARLLENELDQASTATELYGAALQVDPGAAGALEALVRLSASRGDFGELIALLGRTAERSDDATDRALALYRMGRLSADRLGNRQEAVAALASAVASAPRDPLILEELARLYAATGDHEALAATLREMIDISTEAGDRLALLHTLGGLCERDLGREDEGIKCYREALALDPTYLPVLQAHGKLLAKREDWEGLVEMHLAEAAHSASSVRRAAAHARAAEILETRLGRPADAAEHHARALALVPGHPASFKALDRLYAQAGKHRELIELFEQAVDEAPTVERKVTYLFKVGALWEDALGDAVQAAHGYRRILKLQPDNLGALHALQRVTEKAGRYDEVVECLEREAELTNEKELVLGLLHRAGTILDEQLSNAGGAKQRFLRALEIDAGFVPALASLGRIYYRAGHWDDLLEMYRRQLDGATDRDARVGLLTKMGELCERQRGKPSEAVGYYREAVELAPAYRPAVRALERLLRASNAYEELARLLDREAQVIEEPAGRALALYRIGELYEERLDAPELAIDLYRKALAELPDYRPAAIALARLLERSGAWPELCTQLEHEAQEAADPRRKCSLLQRLGEIWCDHCHDDDRAIACFEAALAAASTVGSDDAARESSLPALLALEPVYARKGNSEALARVYRLQTATFADPASRLAAWRELGRLQESKGVGEPRDRARTYEEILALAPNDTEALRALGEVARQLSDTEMLTRIYVRLGEAEPDQAVAAQHWLRLGHLLESTRAAGAMEAYRAALLGAPDSLAAVRGLARVAEASGEASALVEAIRREAALTVDAAGAAELLVRSACLCLERCQDRAGAIADFERALELAPDNGGAAEMLTRLLVGSGQADHLIDVLSKAAGAAQDPERQASLWLTVAEVHADQQKNAGAAVAALRRGLKISPRHVGIHRTLIRTYLGNAQWPEAVAALETLLELDLPAEARTDAHLEIAALYDERLGDADKARAALESALGASPDHAEALARMAKLQVRHGDLDAAEATLGRVLKQARGDRERAGALLLQATVARARGDSARAERALADALAIEGPSGEAAAEYQKLIAGGAATWVGFAAALGAHLRRGVHGDDLVATYVALAATNAERMSLPRKALEVLVDGLLAVSGGAARAHAPAPDSADADADDIEEVEELEGLEELHELDEADAALADGEAGGRGRTQAGRLIEELLERARASDQLDEAAGMLHELVVRHERAPELWRAFVRVLRASGRSEQARLAAMALPALGAPPVEDEPPARARPLLSDWEPGAIAPAAGAVAVEGAIGHPAAFVIAACAEGLVKLMPTDLASYGLSRKDRLPRGVFHTARERYDDVSAVFGVEFEVYEHDSGGAPVTVGFTEPVSVLVSNRFEALPQGQQIFLMARSLAAAAFNLHPVLSLPAAELERLLEAGTRQIVPEFGGDDLHADDMTNRLKKVLSRKARKALEAAAPAYAAAPLTSVAAWQQAVVMSLNRIAALLCDDLAASVKALSLTADGTAPGAAPTAPRAHEITDLLRFWLSAPAAQFRARSTGAG